MRRKLRADRAEASNELKTKKHRWQVSAVAIAAATVLGFWAPNAAALSLGRITVQSALGEPLRAEIDLPDINASEAESLRTGAASPDAFRAAGLEYNPALIGMRIVLQRRPDGRMFLQLSSDRPVNDPFMDLILEATWSSGKIVRDYTMLFDPPAMRAGAAPAPTAPQVAVAPPTTAPAVTAPRSSVPAVAAPASPAATARPTPVRPAPAVTQAPPRPAAAAGGQQVTVKAGDTAGKIAAANKPANVSLDQMLVAMLRSNPEAFMAGNVNRIKAGAVLDMPDAAQASAVSADDASQTVIAQSKDFNAFRRRLATAAPAVQVATAERSASGKVQAQVEDKKPSTAAPDKLTLSKGAMQGKASEDKVAKEGQAKDASTRVAELSKNISDLNKIGAAASPSAPAATASAPASVTAPAAAPVAAPPAAAASAAAPAAPTVAAPMPAPVASAPEAAAPAVPVAAPPVAAAASAPAAPKPTAAPQPEAEPSLVDSLMENPLIPAAAAGLIALLAGFGIYRARQRKKTGHVDSSFLESRLQPDSFFGASGGQHVDTKDDTATGSSMAYSPSQLDAAGDVDPVAEADVYLAYGRDLQAEEILKEALRATPARTAIHAKLLEIYAKRQDVKAFEALAADAHRLTGGTGTEWERICELGREIDAGNALYQPGGQPAGGGAAAAAAGVWAAATAPAFAPEATQPDPGKTFDAAGPVDIDLDLDFSLDAPTEALAPQPEAPMAPTPVPARADEPTVTMNAVTPIAPSLDLGFDADTETTQSLTAAAPPQAAPSPAAPEPAAPPLPDISEGLTFSLDVADSAPAASAPAPLAAADKATAADSGPIEFDLGSLTLDLDASTPAHTPSVTVGGSEDDPLATKLALAEEFNAIGDADGARALVEEVIAEASGSLRTKAQRLLTTFG